MSLPFSNHLQLGSPIIFLDNFVRAIVLKQTVCNYFGPLTLILFLSQNCVKNGQKLLYCLIQLEGSKYASTSQNPIAEFCCNLIYKFYIHVKWNILQLFVLMIIAYTITVKRFFLGLFLCCRPSIIILIDKMIFT